MRGTKSGTRTPPQSRYLSLVILGQELARGDGLIAEIAHVGSRPVDRRAILLLQRVQPLQRERLLTSPAFVLEGRYGVIEHVR